MNRVWYYILRSVEVLIGNKEYEISIGQAKPILEKLKESVSGSGGGTSS